MLRTVGVDHHNIDNLHAQVVHRSDSNADYRAGPLRRMNKQGTAFLNIMSNDVKVRVIGNPQSDSCISGMRVRWQVGDNRDVRGPYAGPTT